MADAKAKKKKSSDLPVRLASAVVMVLIAAGAYALGGATPPGTLHVMDDHEFRPRNDLPTWMRLAVVGFLAVLVGAVILGMAVY